MLNKPDSYSSYTTLSEKGQRGAGYTLDET